MKKSSLLRLLTIGFGASLAFAGVDFSIAHAENARSVVEASTRQAPTYLALSEAQYRTKFGKAPVIGAPKELPNGARVQFSSAVMQPLDPPQPWYKIDWAHRDLDGRDLPTRHGNEELGYLHYAAAHNIGTERAIKTAYENNYPDENTSNGNHLEYLAFITDTQGDIEVTVRVVDEQAPQRRTASILRRMADRSEQSPRTAKASSSVPPMSTERSGVGAEPPDGSEFTRSHPAGAALDGAYRRILNRAMQLTAPLLPGSSPSVIGVIRTADDRFITVISVSSSPSQRSRLTVSFRLTSRDGVVLAPMAFSSGLERALAVHLRDPSADAIEAPEGSDLADAAGESLYYSLKSLSIEPSVSDSEAQRFRRVFPFYLSGFLKVGSGKLRAYLTYYADRTTIAVDLPIAEDGAESVRTASASILGELASLLRSGIPDHVASHEVEADPYCDRAFDMFTWFLGSAE